MGSSRHLGIITEAMKDAVQWDGVGFPTADVGSGYCT